MRGGKDATAWVIATHTVPIHQAADLSWLAPLAAQVCRAGVGRPRKIWLTRHGESQFNVLEKIGGNSALRWVLLARLPARPPARMPARLCGCLLWAWST